MAHNNMPRVVKTHNERAKEATVRVQLASLQYILSRLQMSDASRHTDPFSTASLEGFVKAFYPFPQVLEPGAIKKVLEDVDILKRIQPIFERAKIICEQRKIFQTIKDAVRYERVCATQVDPSQPNTLGWRAWYWEPKRKMLQSPSQIQYFWEAPELRVSDWDTSDVVRGCSGIHACLMPKNWEIADPAQTDMPIISYGGKFGPLIPIVGVVERFDRYVLGTTGWRAEWVIIRKLLAPTQELGFALEMAYPDVEVKYFDTIKYGDYS